ncbi:MAG TPA: DUF92 domain-containing protein [Candidatus Polarisedimenticolia bacterium]
MSRTAGAPGLTAGEIARKTLHVGVGLMALLLPWLTRWQAASICAAAFLMNWQVLPRITRHRLEREDERRKGFAEGILEYPLAVGALFVLFGSRMEVVAAAWAILAFGDGFATIAGKTLGGARLPWNPDKTFSGLLAFVAFGGLASTAMATWVFSGAHPTAVEPPLMIACYTAALLAGLVESLPTGVNDNISVPLISGAFLYSLTYVDLGRLTGNTDHLARQLAWGAAVNLLVSGAAWMARTVKTSGAIAGFLIGVIVYAFGGWQAYVILILFFVLASAATSVGYERKAAKRIAQAEGGRRGARHAIANCGVPAFLAFLAATTVHTDLCMTALAAALATAVFDTVSSEIGQVYGKRPFLITTFRRVPPGTDGAVSMEGTLAGLSAAAVLAAASFGLGMMGGIGWAGAIIVVVAAFIGTTAESYLGALSLGAAGDMLSRIDNEAMNFANTAVGALSAMALCALVLS